MTLPSFLRKHEPPPAERDDDTRRREELEAQFARGIDIRTGVSLNEAELIELLRLQEEAARRVS